jgi:hypothetical protein
MGTVFITQQPRPNSNGWTPNLSPAAKYGKFVYVFAGDDTPWANPKSATEQAIATLSKYNPDDDFILYPNSGDPMSIFIIVAVLARLAINKITFLYWERNLIDGKRSRTDGFYSPITLNLPIL